MGADTPSVEGERNSFVHLHLHTEYSLLDGGNRIDKLVSRVKELGMDAVAVTDHGNLFGAVAFYRQARKAGIKPILGIEAYVAPGDRRSREYTGIMDGGYHLVLLAENEVGWQNLLYLSSESYLTGFYFKPRMDREILESHAEGLIAISGHLGSELAHHLVEYDRTGGSAHFERAVEAAEWHARTFRGVAGPGFYVEMQHHISEQNNINPHLIRLAREMELPLVCDNDSHFLRKEDHDAHDTLICISMGKSKNDASRLRYPHELYVKSPQEMRELFVNHYEDVGREALDNTEAIAARCNVELPLDANHVPIVRVRIEDEQGLPDHGNDRYAGDLSAWHSDFSSRFDLVPFEAAGESESEAVKNECDRALRLLCEAGMVWRYGPSILDRDSSDDTRRKWARLERELGILADKLISPYFLIVWDFVNWGREKGIPANARGSGVGTMVGYVLGLSNACPVQYGLLFERFTDPDRTEYPDIDIDLCQDGRGDVINYVRQKYGHVAQIITFGTLKARAAVRDVCRVLEVPLADADKLAKLIPEQLGMTLDAALEQEPELRKLYEDRDDVRRVIDTGRSLEGQARHCSVHAAGVIVATRPLHEIVPLYKQSGAGENEIVTQWDGPTCERMGLLKMDFLGLRTLSTIERTRTLIREGLSDTQIHRAVGRSDDDNGPHPLDLDRLAFDDPRVFSLFQRGDTAGVFQFESGGMRRLLMDMKPDRLEDLIAANALFRPGPMDLIPDYNRRKHGRDKVPHVHEIVDRFTAEAYGVMVYQEQVMQILHELGGLPLRAAYSLIKAISKKKKSVIDSERSRFIDGATSAGLTEAKAQELFDLILKFAGYGFNKSHSTGYAIVAYQTAYLKAYFPNQYMAAFLSFESQAQKVSDWITYLEDCKRTRFTDGSVGVEVRPPDINLSEADFGVVFAENEDHVATAGHVRFGLKAIKGAGAKAINTIIDERNTSGRYRSLFDFCERVPSAAVNKATIESLIRCGAFDAVHGRENRGPMCATVDQAVASGQRLAQDRASGQGNLFMGDADDEPAPEPALSPAPEWSEAETLRLEKETLGFYVSNHPLDEWRCWSSVFADATIEDVAGKNQDKRVRLAALVQSVRTIVVRSGRSVGQKMAIVTIEDLTGTMEAVLFADRFKEFEHLVEPDAIVFVLGRVDRSRGDTQVIVDRLAPIEAVPLEKGRLRLRMREPENGADPVDELATVVRNHTATGPPNGIPVVPFDLEIQTDGVRVMLRPEQAPRIELKPQFVNDVTEVLGPGSVQIEGGITYEQSEPRRGARTE